MSDRPFFVPGFNFKTDATSVYAGDSGFATDFLSHAGSFDMLGIDFYSYGVCARFQGTFQTTDTVFSIRATSAGVAKTSSFPEP